VAPSVRFERAIEGLYFGTFRNAGSPIYLLKIALGVVFVAFPIAAYSRFQLSYHDSITVTYCLASLVPLGLVFVLYRYALQFRRTGMMLIGEGNGLWSIHMAAMLSFRPKKYAEMNTRFMITGARAIIRAAMLARPGDIIMLESHLLGDDATRRKQCSKLVLAFPSLSVWEGPSKKPLGRLDAWQLNRHKRAFAEKLHREPTADFRAGDQRGMIVLELP